MKDVDFNMNRRAFFKTVTGAVGLALFGQVAKPDLLEWSDKYQRYFIVDPRPVICDPQKRAAFDQVFLNCMGERERIRCLKK